MRSSKAEGNINTWRMRTVRAWSELIQFRIVMTLLYIIQGLAAKLAVPCSIVHSMGRWLCGTSPYSKIFRSSESRAGFGESVRGCLEEKW